jgi:hypothetical protein
MVQNLVDPATRYPGLYTPNLNYKIVNDILSTVTHKML